MKFLYISPDFSDKHIDNVPKTVFLYDAKLDLQPFKNEMAYQVDQTCTMGDCVVDLRYTVTVAFSEKLADYFVFTINKTLDTEQELPTVFDEFIEEVMLALYPLALIVNDNGNWIGIQNFAAIHTSFQNVKQAILDNYEGIEIMKRLKFYDILFNDETRMTQLLQQGHGGTSCKH